VNSDNDLNQWLPVIARSFAFLCLHQADLKDKDLATKGLFLEGLGLARADIAAMLGATPKTLTEVMSRARSRNRGKNGKGKTKGKGKK
jgi:hypothetical protein